MNSLTDQERMGLEEVFRSITPKREQTLLQRIKKSVDLLLERNRQPMQKQPFIFFKEVTKMPKIGYFKPKYPKKKKFLS